jgi:hypothetical protein
METLWKKSPKINAVYVGNIIHHAIIKKYDLINYKVYRCILHNTCRRTSYFVASLWKICWKEEEKNKEATRGDEDGTRLSKYGAIMEYGYCKKEGHNISACTDLKAAIIKENDMDQEEQHAPQLHLPWRTTHITTPSDRNSCTAAANCWVAVHHTGACFICVE